MKKECYFGEFNIKMDGKDKLIINIQFTSQLVNS